MLPVSHRRADRRTPLPPGYWTIWSTVAVDLLGFGIILPVLPLYAERFDAGPTTIGLLVASFSLAQFVCSPLLGRLSDRVGRKPVLVLSLFGSALGSAITGLAGSVAVLFAGRIIDGASGASVSVAQGAVTDVVPPAERARALGLLGAAFGVGFVLGPALGGLAALAGPRVPFFLAAAVAAANGVAALVRLPETRPAHPRAPAPTPSAPTPSAAVGAATPSRAAALRRLVVVAFTATAAFAGFEATFSLLGQRRFDLTEASIAAVFVGIGLALVAVQAGLVGPVTDRLGASGALRLGLACNAAGLLLLAPATTWPLLVTALGFLVFGQGLVTPALAASAANLAGPDERGRVLGRQQSAGALARVLGPAAAGALFERVGIPAPYLLGAALLGVALALVVPMREPVPSPHAHPA